MRAEQVWSCVAAVSFQLLIKSWNQLTRMSRRFIFGDNDDSTKTPSIGRTRASEVRQEVDDYTIFHD